jgi:hypothetical protein
MRRLLASGFALAALAGPASACLNDVELPNHEREFRSQYNGHPAPPPEPPAPPSDYTPIFSGGVALLLGGAGLAWLGDRSRA